MRKLELARAMAAEPEALDRRRGDGRTVAQRGRRIIALLIRLNEQGVTVIMIEHTSCER